MDGQTVRRGRLVAALVGGTAALGSLSLLAGPAALVLLPAFALAAFLLVGRYPGEQTIHRLRGLRSRPAGQRRPISSVRPRPLLRAARTGITLAFCLAVRPPPALLTPTA